VTAGAIINLDSTQLPKAESIRLQPENERWFKIDEEERKAVLEFHLRRHQFVEEGECLRLEYRGHVHRLTVKAVKPAHARAVSITDTDLSTEVVNASKMGLGVSSASEAKKGGGEAGSVGDRDDGIKLEDNNKPRTVDLNDGEYILCHFDVEDVASTYTVEVSGEAAREGVDMYLNSDPDKPPSHVRFDKASQCEELPSLSISDADTFFARKTFYLAIRARDATSKKTRAIIKLSSKERGEHKGYTLGGKDARSTNANKEGRGTGDRSAVSSSSSASGKAQCANCKRMVPAGSLTMHQLQCARRNVHCEFCLSVVPKKHFKRHRDLVHSPVNCPDCGIEVKDQKELVGVHKRQKCVNRLLPCAFCAMRIRWRDRDKHQAECGMRSCVCLKCGQQFKKREMKYHLTSKHGVVPEMVSFRDYV